MLVAVRTDDSNDLRRPRQGTVQNPARIAVVSVSPRKCRRPGAGLLSGASQRNLGGIAGYIVGESYGRAVRASGCGRERHTDGATRTASQRSSAGIGLRILRRILADLGDSD